MLVTNLLGTIVSSCVEDDSRIQLMKKCLPSWFLCRWIRSEDTIEAKITFVLFYGSNALSGVSNEKRERLKARKRPCNWRTHATCKLYSFQWLESAIFIIYCDRYMYSWISKLCLDSNCAKQTASIMLEHN